jgi:GTPase SAR1 family protein
VLNTSGSRGSGSFCLPLVEALRACYLFSVSLSRPSTFVRLDDWVRLVRTDLQPGRHVPIMLVGAKCDVKREVMVGAARDLVSRLNLDGYVETSSKENIRVEKQFSVLFNIIVCEDAKPAL